MPSWDENGFEMTGKVGEEQRGQNASLWHPRAGDEGVESDFIESDNLAHILQRKKLSSQVIFFLFI